MIFLLLAVIEDQRKLYSDFERLAFPHMEPLFNFALWLTGHDKEAGKLLNETYLKAFNFFDKFDQSIDSRMWLFRIMQNSFLSKHKPEAEINFNEAEEYYEKIKKSSKDISSLEKIFTNNFSDDDIRKFVSTLPVQFRMVIVLSDTQNFSYEQIADFVDIPEGTVMSRLHRGRKILFTKMYDSAKSKGYIN